MRKYPGVFTQYVWISEDYLAQEAGVKRKEIYESLIALAKRKIISYVPGNDRPYIVYHQPRLPVSYLTIGKAAYEDRKKTYASKIKEMIRYIEDGSRCRQLVLMDYFGQKEKKGCGICDVCLETKKYMPPKAEEKVEEGIRAVLTDRDTDLKALLHELEDQFGRELLIATVRDLLDRGEIYYKTPLLLSVKNES